MEKLLITLATAIIIWPVAILPASAPLVPLVLIGIAVPPIAGTVLGGLLALHCARHVVKGVMA